MAIHHFDALRFVLGDEPVEVSCQSWTEPESPFKGRPAAIAAIRMAEGTVVSYRGSWISRGPTTPYGGYWRLDGTARARSRSRYRGAWRCARDARTAAPLHRPARRAQAALPAMPLKDRKGSLDAFARWVADGAAAGRR